MAARQSRDRERTVPAGDPRTVKQQEPLSHGRDSEPAWSDIQRVLRSFGFAGAGIMTLLQSQPNARVHVILGIGAAWLAYWLQISAIEWAVLALTMGLVLVTEAVNSALESAVDLASPSVHPLARQAKDIAAGAVLLSAITAVAVGLALFAPRILALLPK